MDDTLIGGIIGGVIAGVAGIGVAWYSKRLNDDDWMKTNVYGGLYNWISSRLNDFQLNDSQVYADQTKSQITPSNYERLDKKIRKKLDAFIDKGRKWDEMWSKASNKFEKRNTKIFDNFIQPLKDANLINSNNYITIGNSFSSADTFFNDFFLIFIDPSTSSPDDLYNKMKEYSTKKNRNLEYLDEIKKEKPEFFDLIYHKLNMLRDNIFTDITFYKLMKEADETREALSELIKSLREKLQ